MWIYINDLEDVKYIENKAIKVFLDKQIKKENRILEGNKKTHRKKKAKYDKQISKLDRKIEKDKRKIEKKSYKFLNKVKEEESNIDYSNEKVELYKKSLEDIKENRDDTNEIKKSKVQLELHRIINYVNNILLFGLILYFLVSFLAYVSIDPFHGNLIKVFLTTSLVLLTVMYFNFFEGKCVSYNKMQKDEKLKISDEEIKIEKPRVFRNYGIFLLILLVYIILYTLIKYFFLWKYLVMLV